MSETATETMTAPAPVPVAPAPKTLAALEAELKDLAMDCIAQYNENPRSLQFLHQAEGLLKAAAVLRRTQGPASPLTPN